MEARRAHNPEVVGSSPASATIKSPGIVRFQDFFLQFSIKKLRTLLVATEIDPILTPIANAKWFEKHKELLGKQKNIGIGHQGEYP